MGTLKMNGYENDGPSKLQGMKWQDMKMTDQIAGHENAGHEIAGHEIAGHEIARHDQYLFIVVSTNPSNFSSIVENSM